MEVSQAIRERRSIRKMKTDPIEDSVLEQVLEAARWAPSWSNTQCTRLIVVRNPEIKAKLAETMFSFQRPSTAGPKSTGQSVLDAPVTIVICAKLGAAGCRAGGEALTDKEGYWYMYDTGIATQNLCLEAHSLGLGTVIIGAFDAVEAGKVLNVPEGYCVVAFTPLGYPDQDPAPTPRKELSEIVCQDTFQG